MLPEENSLVDRREWVYGYWFKVKHMRRLAERRKLDWQKHGSNMVDKFVTSLILSTGVFFSAHSALYKGQPALILAFANDDDRRRLDRVEFSESQIDKIRRKIGLPAGTKPRWYELDGRGYDSNEEVESDDEKLPDKLLSLLNLYASSRATLAIFLPRSDNNPTIILVKCKLLGIAWFGPYAYGTLEAKEQGGSFGGLHW
ncbi:uncharacterized protein FOMMEDRAFT_148561 [Fomitiporia mediterranea MF3/22]|uniref:uncharacterized protein n=1 Tax=Fomitiporia mediterranea (strain MF3/22) TaxID=694068 RepID=UPI000440782E|nr:uncharacterized protein FOMMEDRAFT_148561 [Fomitiporia mediterranea MF3/22]EJC99677.1 hypothetical protein FOMMEDRAFT_148561 [Fomitiporia mediterranea MF3/22]